MDEELQALEAELAQLRAAVNAPATTTTPTDIRPDAPTGYGGLKQFGADILFGVPKGVAGTIDILSYLPTKALQYAGAPTEPWGTTKLVNALIESNQGLEGPGAAEILGVRPSTSVQKAIEFMTPGPGGKGKLLPQLAKESSLGLLAYGGSELGEYATGGPGGALIGALAAPVLMTKVPQFVGSQVASRLAEPTALLRGDEAAIQKAAVQEILDRAGPEGAARIALAQELQTPLMSPLGVPMTAAEIAQTPSLATYQYAMSKPEMGGQTLLDALAKRKEEQALAFGALGTQPQKGQLSEALRTVAAEQGILKADEAIKAIDFDLASRNPTAIEAPSALVQPLGAELRTEIKIAAEEAKKAGREAFKDPAVYNVVVDVPNIRQDVNRIIRGWKRDPSQRIGDATVLTQIKRLRQLDMPKEDLPEGFVPSVKIGQLHDIQVQLGKVLSSTKQGERTPAQALALNLYKYIESVMENAPGSDALFAAKDKWKNYFDTFVYDKERGVISPLKQALKKTPEKVVPFLAGESASIEALKKAGVGARQIETQKLSEFMNLPTAEKKLAWITKNRPALSGADFWPSIENAEQTLKATLEPGQLTEFAKVSEGQIPSQIFSDLGKARRFMKDVEGTQLEDLTRGKFIETLQTGKGTIADRLASQRDVAKTIFKGDYDRLKTIIDDIEGAASPERLKQLATGKQSITSQSQTTLGAIMNKRSLLRLAQNSKYISGIIGTTAGAAGPGGWLGGILVGGAAQAGAMKLGKKAEAVEQRLNATIAEMLAKPELIKFAEAPPTVKNVESFFKQAARLGYLTKEEFISQQPYVHGTSEAGSKAIEQAQAFIPKTINYSVLGEGTIYGAKKNSWWFDPEKAAAGRMWELPNQVPIYLKPEANVTKIKNDKDWEKLASKLNMTGEELASALYFEPGVSKAKVQQAKAIKQRLIDSGVDAIEIGKQPDWIKSQAVQELQNKYIDIYYKFLQKGDTVFNDANIVKRLPVALLDKLRGVVGFKKYEFGDDQLAIINHKVAEPAEYAYERLLKSDPSKLLRMTPEEKELLPPAIKEQVARLGYFGARGAQQAGEQAPVSPTATPTEDTEIADLEAELESLRQMLPKQEAKVGKQNISIPTGEKYAPASLVKAVMKVESGGKQDAVSSKGARGLMQLMPATARDLGVDATDPEQNVEGGSRYLAQQLSEFGDESLALAAYNWGPNNIKRAIAKVRAEGKRPTWANIKAYVKIPKETREYVDKVLSLVQEGIMPWAGGNYTKGNSATGGWTGDASLGIGIEAGRHDTQDNDFATGINQCLNKDGTNAATGNLNLGGFLPTNLGAGTAAAPAICAGNDLNTGVFSPAADTWAIATNGSERLRINSTGEVGIGNNATNGSLYKLQVGSANGQQLLGVFGGSSGTSAGSAVYFFNGGTPSGQIGNYSAIQGGAYDGRFTIKNAGSSFVLLGVTAAVGTHFLKWNNSTGAWTYDTSSARYKDNIQDSQYGLAEVLAMRPTTFTYKAEPNRKDVGFIAEEMVNVVPEVVAKNLDGQPDAISYDRLTSVLCKAIQELNVKVESLKARIAELEP